MALGPYNELECQCKWENCGPNCCPSVVTTLNEMKGLYSIRIDAWINTEDWWGGQNRRSKRENLYNISTQNKGQLNFLTMYKIALSEQSSNLSLTETRLEQQYPNFSIKWQICSKWYNLQWRLLLVFKSFLTLLQMFTNNSGQEGNFCKNHRGQTLHKDTLYQRYIKPVTRQCQTGTSDGYTPPWISHG